MKKLSLMTYMIKNHYKIIILYLLFIYLIVLPLSYHQDDIQIFNNMQQLLLIPSMILLSYLYDNYVEKDYKELIYSLDRSFKYINVMMIYMFIQLLLLPFYMIYHILPYILIFSLQLLTLYSIYYLFSHFFHMSFMVLGLLILYILLYSFVLRELYIGNILLISIEYHMIDIYYYISLIITMVLSLIIGIILEKKYIMMYNSI
ncbi:MAG: hypothetical protein LUG60_01810 [Erysipelotrichaceae bacterium]|nr:hypothetical protein [Erysipelotrichaceae bacterium]